MSEIIGAWIDQLTVADRFIEGYWNQQSPHFNESSACKYMSGPAGCLHIRARLCGWAVPTLVRGAQACEPSHSVNLPSLFARKVTTPSNHPGVGDDLIPTAVLRERYPLPRNVDFILCQKQACVIGEARAPSHHPTLVPTLL